ncbi:MULTISPECIES: nitroreductase family protein [Clostridium]|uniref:Nitroreductase family protein n=1 Tax=Clostridium frigoriphilum TaxID=443253 RepID=A0ABU7UU10_9CLOT|nr:nitroreductase family protein [Clostridium sp. DSM 17811]MBU3100871.1 nitroreductase family protein [Clostridium sp. DSM 17811]
MLLNYAFSEPSRDYWIQDCSAATENILIAAMGLGLGTLWIGLYPIPSKLKPVRKALDIPEYVIPLNVIYIGYADERKKPRKKTLSINIHYSPTNIILQIRLRI